MPKTLKIWGFEVHRTGNSIDLLRRWCAFVYGNHAVHSASDGSGLGDAYQHHNIVPQALFQVMKELHIQVTDPSVLVISSAIQDQMSATKTWSRCGSSAPKTYSVVLNLSRRQLILPSHDARGERNVRTFD